LAIRLKPGRDVDRRPGGEPNAADAFPLPGLYEARHLLSMLLVAVKAKS
jgi:hypothetical protein